MIQRDKFKDYCIGQFTTWFEDFKRRKYVNCDEISQKHIELCTAILKKNIWDASEENNVAYVTGVLFKGLSEFTQLANLTKDRKWHLDHERTEKIWGIMWNCIERFEFCAAYFATEDFTWMINTLIGLRDDFVKHFGYGLYASPEILIKREICSICKKDTRACSHIPGSLYNGHRCCTLPQDFEMRSVSLVTVPRDPRCRVWPWHMKEDWTFTTTIMVLFSIDDWLKEDKEL